MQQKLLTFLSFKSASEVTTLWRYTNLFINIIKSEQRLTLPEYGINNICSFWQEMHIKLTHVVTNIFSNDKWPKYLAKAALNLWGKFKEIGTPI